MPLIVTTALLLPSRPLSKSMGAAKNLPISSNQGGGRV
eukprot:CAMPEP_0115387652 /NCGR_PEP_ID=MMETSP0271-20121206/8772_1 /TAXON_ID=71861 /ORGANISM="Scrippsiella trochoidea, Strain CCMP3099" /LENGTH=37 /DNA_ID= /DNA_START= /DNA_END= /DNA_ORIENTATION=